VFLKYVSDAFKERREELKAAFTDPNHDYYLGESAGDLIEQELEARDYYTEKNVFWVPALARWDFIKDHAKVPPRQDSCVCRSNAVRMEGICSDSMRSCRSDGGTDPPKSACRGRLQTTPERHWLKTVVVSVGGEGGSMWPVRYESRRRAQANHRQGAETE